MEKSFFSKMEEEVLKFWKKNNVFKKSIEQRDEKKSYVFYDGPPFANDLPHYGHILQSVIKDIVPRYWAMKGYRVERRWGWDCHGLPVENAIEKELGLKSKKDIEKMGVEKFNEACRASVLRYATEWRMIIERMGRWIDMDNDYKTMDLKYMESVWWAFKSLWDKNLIYQDYKSMHICPRCETSLSNFEVTLGYKDIKDISAIVKFELIDEPNTYILAWTTTPWTLPGNVALAVNSKIDYVKISLKLKVESQKLGEYFILAKDRLVENFKDQEYEIVQEFKGTELIGKKYKLLFDYYTTQTNEEKSPHLVRINPHESAFGKIYSGDFVSIEEGTGVVHIAPAFGEDDMALGKKNNLPFIQHVGMDGRFTDEVVDFKRMEVKPKDNHQATDIEIIKYLAHRNKLFSKEKYEHSYPHCWRCDTPLLNYVTNSWFVKVMGIKDKMIKNNQEINWIPEHIKDGRFGKWLENSRDWAISRSRYWGAVLPVWKCQGQKNTKTKKYENNCGNIKVIGSIEEIKNHLKKSGNKYFTMRHGEGEQNVLNIANNILETSIKYNLTENGKKQVKETAQKLKDKKIDLIFSSNFHRAKQTAMIAAEEISFDKEKIIYDSRINEFNIPTFSEGHSKSYYNFCPSLLERFYKRPPNGENLNDLKKRVGEFLYEIEKKYSKKNILIISHEYPIWMMFSVSQGLNEKESVEIKKTDNDFILLGEMIKLNFSLLPHNDNYVLDFHRPYIDKIEFQCDKCGGIMKRISEVFDCWFESGSMPYAQEHYPFENKEKFEKNFPAQFIAEGQDQTRGWFYTLTVLSSALFNKPAFKNVVVTGMILAEDGKKMSKRLKNYPDPKEIFEKYSADAMRFYLVSSSVVKAESLCFSEKGVNEVNKKVLNTLWNIFQFYELHSNNLTAKSLPCIIPKEFIQGYNLKATDILDQWILAKLNLLIKEVTENMDHYQITQSCRFLENFINELSIWYIRRSRERFKLMDENNQQPLIMLHYILLTLSKLMAPFTPFISEKIYQNLIDRQMSNVKCQMSIHLCDWPQCDEEKIDQELIEQIELVRQICELGHSLRSEAGIKVRQTLASLKIKNQKLKIKNKEEYLNLIKEELNVKEVEITEELPIGEVWKINENKIQMALNIEITSELKQEGIVREIIRQINALRKEVGLTIEDKINLFIYLEAGEIKEVFEKFKKQIKKSTICDQLSICDNQKIEKVDFEKEIEIENQKVWIGIKKL